LNKNVAGKNAAEGINNGGHNGMKQALKKGLFQNKKLLSQTGAL
jgi:hypothetical protein